MSALIPDMMNNRTEPLKFLFMKTAEDAQNGENAIPNPDNYTNATPFLQFIYVRVLETQYNCFNTFMLTLIVAPAPQAYSLEDIILCDDADNNGQDGKRRVFSSTVQNTVIADALGIGVDNIPDDLIIKYYSTETGRPTGYSTLPTGSPTLRPIWVMMKEVIWVRVVEPCNRLFYGVRELHAYLQRTACPYHAKSACDL